MVSPPQPPDQDGDARLLLPLPAFRDHLIGSRALAAGAVDDALGRLKLPQKLTEDTFVNACFGLGVSFPAARRRPILDDNLRLLPLPSPSGSGPDDALFQAALAGDEQAARAALSRGARAGARVALLHQGWGTGYEAYSGAFFTDVVVGSTTPLMAAIYAAGARPTVMPSCRLLDLVPPPARVATAAPIVRLLLEAGADPLDASDEGNTAAHYAVHYNDVPAMELLVRSAAACGRQRELLAARNLSGSTPADTLRTVVLNKVSTAILSVRHIEVSLARQLRGELDVMDSMLAYLDAPSSHQAAADAAAVSAAAAPAPVWQGSVHVFSDPAARDGASVLFDTFTAVSAPTWRALRAADGPAAAVPQEAVELARETLRTLERWSLQITDRAPWTGQLVVKPRDAGAGPELGALLPRLAAAAEALFASQPRVPRLHAPVAVLGDTHGNLADVMRFFAPRLWPVGPREMLAPVVFLGDYVDRGYNSPELVAYLFAHALLAPPLKFVLLRGNHEDRRQNGASGGQNFKAVCTQRYGVREGDAIWRAVNKAFDTLPFAARVAPPGGGGDAFCAHGGIARLPTGAVSVTAALEALPPRVAEPAAHPVLVGALWNDPADDMQEAHVDVTGFLGDAAADAAHVPRPRGGGGPEAFGAAAVNAFCAREGVALVVRGHTAQARGLALQKGARVCTVFSDARDHGGGGAAAYVVLEPATGGGALVARTRVCEFRQ